MLFAAQSMQTSVDDAPVAVEYLPAKQFVQPPDPASALYVPARHAEHEPPLGPV